MIKRLKSVSMMLFLLGAASGTMYAAASPRVTDVAITQQAETCTGVVKDAAGEPIIGAAVMVKGTTNGTVTDFDGKFSIPNVKKGDIISISYVGFNTQEVKWAGTPLKIKLREDTQALDEVIVVGYGTTSTRKMVGAVSSMKTDKIDELPFTNTASGLQGRTPGVIIQQNGAAPGSKPTISIRGGGEPLYVIDGVVRDAQDFNSLNASDIEKLSILKDASASAVYGARAGNGIVLVQTKRGKEGRTDIQYTGGVDFNSPTFLPKKLNKDQYVTAANWASAYDGIEPTYSPEMIASAADTDWYDLALRKTAVQQRHNISFSGVTNGVNYYTAFGILDAGSIIKIGDNDTYRRYNLRSNVSKTFDKIGLEVGVNIDGAWERRHPMVNSWSAWNNLMVAKPTLEPYNPDGTYSSLSLHPLADMDPQGGYNNDDDKYANIQMYANWDLPWVKGLKAGFTGNFRINDYNNKTYDTDTPQYNSDGTQMPKNNRILTMSNTWGWQNTFDVNIMYGREINKHSFEIQGVYNFVQTFSENFWARREGFISNDFDQLFSGDASTQQNSGFAQRSARVGYVGRIKYDYAGKYMFEGNFRVDGSDNFADGSRFGFFPSAAVAWVASEEGFWSVLKEKHIFDFFKLRFSAGQVGLEGLEGLYGDDYRNMRYRYIQTYDYDPKAWVIGGKFAPAFSEGPLVSKDLSWYTRTAYDFGIDLTSLNNRLSASFDYFYYRTKGYLVSPQDRYTTPLGKDLPQVKSNSAHRRAGVELNLRWKDTTPRDFHYEVGFNMAQYNELWEQKDDESLSSLMNPEKRITHTKNYYGTVYHNLGLYQSNEQILNNPRREGSAELKRGDIQFQDVNGDGKIDGEDQTRMGKPTFPSFSYGVDFAFDYKGFFLNGLFQGTGERYKELEHFARGSYVEALSFEYQLDYWTPENTDATFPRLSNQGNHNSGNNFTVGTDFWYHNAAYFRLKTLQLGYDFKKVLLKDNKLFTALKLSVVGTNIFTISRVNDFYDPELNSNTGYTYPTQKSYSIVLNIGF